MRCKIQSFWVPVKWDLSRVVDPAKSLSANSTEKFLSESEPSIMQTKNLTGLEWMEGTENEGSGWSVAFETEKHVFIDLPLIMTVEWDLSALNSRPT